jgi:hypothetical protein
LRRVTKILVAASGLCLTAVPVPAFADGPAATGAGAVGTVDVTVSGQPAHSGLIAPCLAGTTPANRTDPIAVGTDTWFGTATTTCTRNTGGTAGVTVSGASFETRILSRYGGPVIRARTFKAACDTVENGSRGQIALSGITGFTVPSTIPANYTVTIPGASPDTRPMAVIVLNELIVPEPSDGSMVTNAMHIKLFPDGGPASGDIVVGNAACAP